jgi:uncharacterized protein involved in exopolysaccharide biosynthesis
MKTQSKNKTGTNATATLAQINAQIEALKQQRVALAEPLKTHYAELRGELAATERQIKELDETWKPLLRPKAETKIAEILTARGAPMTAEEVVQQTAGTAFSPWKIKNTLKKKSTGPKAVFTVNDGKYSVKV